MFGLSSQFKILDSIVGLIVVDMVDDFFSIQVTTNMSFHH